MRPLLLVAVLLAGCAGGTATPPNEEPEPDRQGATYTDAEQTDILMESIDLVYGSEPQADWYAALGELTVEDGWAYVTTSDPSLASSMCTAIAAITFDDAAQPIGVHDVLVEDQAGEALADCDVPAQ